MPRRQTRKKHKTAPKPSQASNPKTPPKRASSLRTIFNAALIPTAVALPNIVSLPTTDRTTTNFRNSPPVVIDLTGNSNGGSNNKKTKRKNKTMRTKKTLIKP